MTDVLNVIVFQAEARAEFAERSVQKLQKEVDRLEGNIILLQSTVNNKYFYYIISSSILNFYINEVIIIFFNHTLLFKLMH